MNGAFSLCLAFLLLGIPAEEPGGCAAGFAPGWSPSGPVMRFVEGNLYDYIDGGAELFIEFGFEDLSVYRFERGEHELTLESYRMGSPESALGIYLMRCGRETPVEGVSSRNSGDQYQFNVVKGSYFIQVNSFEGSDSLVPAMVALTQCALEGIAGQDSVTLLERLPRENLVPGSELRVRGPYALQPIYTFGKGDILQLGGSVFGVVGDYASNVTEGESLPESLATYTRIIVPYATREAASSAYTNLLENLDAYIELLDEHDDGFVFKDYRGRFGVGELRGSVLELKVNLREKPSDSLETE